MFVHHPLPGWARRLVAIALALALGALGTSQAHAVFEPLAAVAEEPAEPAGHLVISELLSGGASASDEFIELFNPSPSALPLEGLEVVYVTASGATITRKAAWPVGASSVAAGEHLLIANESGAYAPVADVTYSGGIAATGGSIALRIQGAASPIDVLGWGTASSSWLEGDPAPAVGSGSSLERLPGGSDGSFQDTDDNAVDFVTREAPDAQNSASPPIGVAAPSPTPSASPPSDPTPSASEPVPSPTLSTSPSPSPSPSVTPSASPTASPTASPSPSPATPSPSPSAPTASPSPSPVVSIADARQLADGARVTIGGVALSDSAFSDGGGYLADDTGGIAVLLSDGGFERGRQLQVSGVLDTRYQQRTLRASLTEVADLGAGADPVPLQVATVAIGEPLEAILVHVHGEVVSSATRLSTAVAYDVDDGSGPVRVLVEDSTGIDTAGWQQGSTVDVVGIVGQRDATGTGSAGYRVQPRDAADVLMAAPTPSPSPLPTATPIPGPSASPHPGPSAPPLMTIAQARVLASGAAVRVRGVVTVASGLIDPTSAVVQDASGAIMLRLGGDAGRLRRGDLVEVAGTRSTKSGMLTIRITRPATRLGSQSEPDAVRRATGSLGEDLEARLVIARGALTAKPRHSTAGTTSFGIDDGSGEVRVSISSGTGIDLGDAAAGTWIEVRGALGQDTTGSQPLRGYRIWPRDRDDVDVLTVPDAGTGLAETPTSQLAGPGGHGTRHIDPASVHLQPAGGSSPVGSRAAAPGRLASSLEPAPDGSLAGRDSRSGALVAEPQPESDRRRPIAVLGLALAALGALTFVGWRNGVVGRLRDVVRAVGDGDGDDAERAVPVTDPGSDPAANLPAAMPRLSVLRVPGERGSP